MISFEEALKIVIDAVIHEVNSETIPLNKSLNRVLAEDVSSDVDMPPFDKSAMDGYACKRADLSQELEVLELIPAGSVPTKEVGIGQCSKIMTGAMLPDGADCVIKVEETEELANKKIKFVANQTKNNFVPTADDVKAGDLVMKSGTIIQPQHFAVFASVGYDRPKVYKQVSVGIISTGDELVEPQHKPTLSQIRNSNAYQLIGQLQKINVTPHYYGIARDDEGLTSKIISKAIAETNVILLTGGVSMGDFDFIPKIFDQLGVNIMFESIAIQPGKPCVFGLLDKKFVFGLPGNPVSSFNLFELLVKPLLYKLMGHSFDPVIVQMPMGKEYSRRKSSRRSFLPVLIKDGKVWPIEYHGSAHINALTNAYGFISIPIGKTILKVGEKVDVRPL